MKRKKKATAGKGGGRRVRAEVQPTFYPPARIEASAARKIRANAATRLRRSVKSLEKLQKENSDFATRHEPAYRQWLDDHLSAELDSVRSLQRRLRERMQILSDLRREVIAKALADDGEFDATGEGDEEEDVNFQFSDPEDFFDDDEDGEDDVCDCPFCRARREGDSEDGSEGGEEFLEQVYAMAFRELFGESPYTNRRTRREFEKFKEDARRMGFVDEISRSKPREAAADREVISYYYRRLVHRLHPDKLGAQDAFQAELWHLAQEARRECDIAALKQLWALCCLGDKQEFAEIPVGDIHHAADRLLQRTAHLRREQRQRRKLNAWGFADAPEDRRKELYLDAKQVFRRASAQLKKDLADIEFEINALKKSGPNAVNILSIVGW